VSHRYVSPETEVELVKPPLTQEGALRTAIYPKERGVDYTFMGLAGETAEFQEKIALISARIMRKRSVRHDLLCELGDVCWYVATASHEVGIALADLPVLDGRAKALRRCFKNPVEAVLRLANALGGAAGKLPNKLKKTIRDGKQISEYREDVVAGLGESLQIAKQIAEALGSSIEQVMADNLVKLNSRAERGVLHGSGDNR
jgi:NTP pyrophosphatase (non-canonical NTP hydrolase)